MNSFTIKGTTKIVGIFGDPINFTLSPQMHNYAFSELNLDFVYLPFLVKEEKLKGAVEALKSLNLVGVNVTIPHKQSIIPYLDECSPLAKKIGAVNTIINRHGRLIGDNTDAPGFLSSLKEDGQFDPLGKKAVILGGGGTAHSIAVALLDSGIKKIVVLNRTLERAQDLIAHLKKWYPNSDLTCEKFSSDSLNHAIRECDLFLNATPSSVELNSNLISPSLFVFDAQYAKATSLLISAKNSGATCLGGLGMLIHQGALSFSLWTGEKPPVSLMKKALEGK
ncbi:MAG: shikimate dehydrogenase [Elusimicrobia bacterium RIFCSPLOWO2_02_FULL_39_32]|nr:MAG: shikimate dehydrogenase [Elusimicrobia bacterium RIFCSPHIGHO2_02_FULL_39_36]OGR92348.1 MAG: shikimate dehydrogenase [Elusimicrobia bacterium RIFCSPLOWO2_02_FULL_39_32]OGR98891.1 MAG: shikimate dehydrogenase [Elusimicrobia bacterium RIFCSPLOWO2_12_FULL_39_28]